MNYLLAWLYEQQQSGRGKAELVKVVGLSPDYFFPSRLHDQLLLEWSLEQQETDYVAAFGLGNYYYDRQRHGEAIVVWEKSRNHKAGFTTVRRNLGIAYWNIRRDAEAASQEYLAALKSDPYDARILYEYDQLRKKLGTNAEARLSMLSPSI